MEKLSQRVLRAVYLKVGGDLQKTTWCAAVAEAAGEDVMIVEDELDVLRRHGFVRLDGPSIFLTSSGRELAMKTS